MTRKMWGLIPVLDCSQLLKLCPSQYKPSVCPITTPAAQEDPPHHTMTGKKHRRSADTHSRRTDTGTRPLRNRTGAARTALISPNIADLNRETRTVTLTAALTRTFMSSLTRWCCNIIYVIYIF